jgi:hypothetical protein
MLMTESKESVHNSMFSKVSKPDPNVGKLTLELQEYPGYSTLIPKHVLRRSAATQYEFKQQQLFNITRTHQEIDALFSKLGYITLGQLVHGQSEAGWGPRRT